MHRCRRAAVATIRTIPGHDVRTSSERAGRDRDEVPEDLSGLLVSARGAFEE
jgi:hypothetical protein